MQMLSSWRFWPYGQFNLPIGQHAFDNAGYTGWVMRLLSMLLLAIGFALDAVTHSSLVVGILLNIPLVLSGLTLSRQFLLQMTALTLLANVLAGVINGIYDGTSFITLLNRLMVLISLFLVGFLSLKVQETTLKMAVVQVERRKAKQEARLRSFLKGFTAPMTQFEFLSRMVRVLQKVMASRTVLLLGPQNQVMVGLPPRNWTLERIDVLKSSSSSWLLSWEGFEVVFDCPTSDGLDFVKQLLSDLSPLYQQVLLREDLEREREQLQNRNEVIRDLMYTFSHDLRTPILANVMSMKLALSGAYGEMGDTYQQTLKNGIQANQDVLSLSERLLQVAQLEVEGEALVMAQVNVSEVLSGVWIQIHPLLLEKDLRLQTHMLEDAWIFADTVQMRRVILNLLDNAIKWSPRGKTIRVDMRRKGNFLTLSVLDEGPGVPEAIRSHLFQRFRKAGAGAGSGLGLYLASKIVTLHQGRILYRRNGECTEFALTLPEVKP